ncbi:MAG: putative lipid II flippase FtsW [Patescibacteria group bacterium]
MEKSFSHQPDYVLTWALVSLVFLGLMMLFTSSSWVSLEKTKSSTYYLSHQILYGLLPGILLAFIFSRISLKFIKGSAALFFILSLISLVLVFIPGLKFEAGGAASWLAVGDFTFQPSEFAKLALVVYLAAFFEKKITQDKIKSFKNSLQPFVVILIPFALLLLFQPDMGTLGIIILIAFLMFFCAGGNLLHVFLLILIGLMVLGLGFLIRPHQAERFMTFLNPSEDTLGASYQVNQSLIALGSGGIFGRGFGNGIQKYNYLPQPMNDTIFAVWAEETGFIGSIFIIFLFLIIFWRGLIISKRAPDDFSRLLAIGILSWIGVQSFIHIMGVCNLIPFTGIPLPFISYGGSALIFALIGTGILINISRRTI